MTIGPVDHGRNGETAIRIDAVFIFYINHLHNNPEKAIQPAISSLIFARLSSGAKSHKHTQ
ncbi:hypothetical protein H7Q97_06200 [Ochrobactrum sp. CM-21-5]|nr:hypothetical protein [Ochrobactrum sp. CM-21-5]MBC2884992.1 hypothetical protein [Ochrobactrum sp. CM-21-5]